MTTASIVYYTDNRLDGTPLGRIAQKQLVRCAEQASIREIVAVSLAPLSSADFGALRIVMGGYQRGILTMFKQILIGLESTTSDVVYLAEHDVLYHPDHFRFIPPAPDVYYYDENVWKVDAATGRALFYYAKQTAQLCASRDLLVGHYRRRVAKVEQNARDALANGERVKNDGFSRHMGFEPGCHSVPRGVDAYKAERWMSDRPSLDVRHGKNLTPSRWSQSEFRNPDACLGWQEADSVPGWGRTLGRFELFLDEVDRGSVPL